MKVKTLLDLAARCTDESAAQELLDKLREEFGSSKVVRHLAEANPDASMEGSSPFVRFELNKVLSNFFVISIQPEIRNGTLCAVVVTNRMNDGGGMQSRDWEVFSDFEEVIDAEPTMTVARLALLCKEEALRQHAKLLGEVGIEPKAALRAARASW